MSVDPYGVKPKYLSGSGQVFEGRGLIKALCWMHSSGGSGQIKFYDRVGEPIAELPDCVIDIVAVGNNTFHVPQPGILMVDGLYLEIPNNTTINVFYEVV